MESTSPSPLDSEDIFHNLPLDLDVLHSLESDLETEEIVSLVFLLYDDVPVAQQKLFVMMKTQSEFKDPTGISTNLLYDWACVEKLNWKEKLIEALLIIKAYSNLKKLLLNVEQLKNHSTHRFINPVKEILFNMCESLISTEAKEIVCHIRDDCIQNNINIVDPYNDDAVYTRCLELYLLNLLSSKYIHLGKWDQINGHCQVADMNHLINILNKLDYKDHSTKLKHCQETMNKTTKGRNLRKIVDSPPHAYGVVIDNSGVMVANNTISATRVNISNEHIFTIYNPNAMGIIFIINQIQFVNNAHPELAKEYAERHGSLEDEARLIKTWKSFGFSPIVKRNQKKNDIFVELEYVLKRLIKEEHSAFVLCVLSHGRKDCVISSDCQPVAIEELEALFNTSEAPLLSGKPKVILIQSCQGEDKLPTVCPSSVKPKLKNIECDGPQSNHVPEKSDMLKFYSTIPHFESFRDTEDGSWFIQTLCDHMDKVEPNTSIDFLEICVAVTRDISSKRYENSAQMPELRSIFTKHFILKKNVV